MKKLLYAFRFLTVLPIGWKQDEDLTEVARSMIFFPFVGLVIGGLLTCFVHLLIPYFSLLAVSTITLFLWIFFTGGLHLDGLSDLFDGFGGRTKEDSLEIMKDSNIGAFGAISLIGIIILKIVFVRELIINWEYGIIYPLILAPGWGRLMEILAIRFFKSARPEGMGGFFKKNIREREWILPFIFLTILTIYLLSIKSVIIIFILLTIMFIFSLRVSKRLGGLTGDCYGAICEISEFLFLFLFAL